MAVPDAAGAFRYIVRLTLVRQTFPAWITDGKPISQDPCLVNLEIADVAGCCCAEERCSTVCSDENI